MQDLADLTPPFKTLVTDIKNKDNLKIWEDIINAENPLDVKLPENLEIKLDLFQKIMVYKLLRDEKLITLVKGFILQNLGKIFI